MKLFSKAMKTLVKIFDVIYTTKNVALSWLNGTCTQVIYRTNLTALIICQLTHTKKLASHTPLPRYQTPLRAYLHVKSVDVVLAALDQAYEHGTDGGKCLVRMCWYFFPKARPPTAIYIPPAMGAADFSLGNVAVADRT
jgi:hypothetical protein